MIQRAVKPCLVLYCKYAGTHVDCSHMQASELSNIFIK